MSGLNTSTANALGAAIASALGSSNPSDITHWQTICQTIYQHLLTDIQITILPGVIVTAGGPTTQTGPAAPVPITPDP